MTIIKITDLQDKAKQLRKKSGISLEKMAGLMGEFNPKMTTTKSTLDRILYTDLPDTQGNREHLHNVIKFLNDNILNAAKRDADLILHDIYLKDAIHMNFERLNVDWGIQGEMNALEFISNDGDYNLSSIFLGRYSDRDSIIFQLTSENRELMNCALTYGILKEGKDNKSFTLLVTETMTGDTAEFNVYSDSYKQISYLNDLFNENPIIQNEQELSEEECEKIFNLIVSDIKN